MKRAAVVNVRVPSAVQGALHKAEEADDRSVSTMAVRILQGAVERGHLIAGLPARRKRLWSALCARSPDVGSAR